MKGDPIRQNLDLVYQIDSERKNRGQPDGSSGRDTCDAASQPDFKLYNVESSLEFVYEMYRDTNIYQRWQWSFKKLR